MSLIDRIRPEAIEEWICAWEGQTDETSDDLTQVLAILFELIDSKKFNEWLDSTDRSPRRFFLPDTMPKE